MTTFIETPRFPDNISYGSSGGPGFKTFIFEGNTGVEQRSITWSIARGRWDVAQGVRDKADMDDLRAFFYNARGRALGFRFKDWGDYQLTNELIGIGDGTNRVFNITKTYGGGNPYVRRIYKPVASDFAVFVDGVLKTTGYTLDATTGVITFDNNPTHIPAAGQPVRTTGEFDVPVRFDVDQMSAAHDGFQIESWSQIPLVELLEESEMV